MKKRHQHFGLGWIVILVGILWMGILSVGAQPFEKGPPETANGGEGQAGGGAAYLKVSPAILEAFKDSYANDRYPAIDLWVGFDNGAARPASREITEQLTDTVVYWLKQNPDVRVLNELANAANEARQQMAILEQKPGALEDFVHQNTRAKLVYLIRVYPAPRVAYGEPQPDLKVSCRLLDLRTGSTVYSGATDWFEASGRDSMCRLAAGIARNSLKEYSRIIASASAERPITVHLFGIETQHATTKLINEIEGSRLGVVTDDHFTQLRDGPYAELVIRAKGRASDVADRVVQQLGDRKMSAEVGDVSDASITIFVGPNFDDALAKFIEAYSNDSTPELRLMVGWAPNGRADQAGQKLGSQLVDVDPTGIAKGLDSSLTDLLMQNKDLVIKDEVAETADDFQVIGQMVQNGEKGLAESLLKKWGQQSIAIVVGLQETKSGDSFAKVLVRVLDLRKGGQVIAKFAMDWSSAGSINQNNIDHLARRVATKALMEYVASAGRAARPQVYTMQVVGLDDDVLADATADTIERRVRGVSGRVRVDPPRKTEDGDSVTSFRFTYAGDSRDLRDELRKMFRSPLGIPSRFYAGNDSEVLIRIGDALKVPAWAAVTNPDSDKDNEYQDFRQQLTDTLVKMGRPRVGVICGKGFVGKVDQSTLAAVVGEYFRVAGCDVLDSRRQSELRDEIVSQHVAFNDRDSLSTVLAQGENMLDLAIVIEPSGIDGAIISLLDVQNARSYGRVFWPDRTALANHKVPVNPDDPQSLGQCIAGQLLVLLAKQENKPNVMEVVVKNARSLSDIQAIAEVVETNIPQICSVNQRSFAYGVGRFVVYYNGPFDVIARRIDKEQRTLGFKTSADRAGSGLFEIEVNEGAHFVPATQPKQEEALKTGGKEPVAMVNNWAVVIGTCDIPGQSPCPGSASAIRFAQTLKQYCGYSDDRVKLLVQGLGEGANEPTHKNILAALSDIASKAQAQDTIILYVGTHGIVSQDQNESFFCPTDINMNNGSDMKTSAGLAAKNLVSATEVRTILANSRAKCSIVILEACHSSGRKDDVTSSPGAAAEAFHRDGTGQITLAGCQAKQESLAFLQEMDHGAFTHFLCEGLAGAADTWEKGNHNGEIDLNELYLYTHDHVSKYVADKHIPRSEGGFYEQDPTMLGIVTGEVVLCKFKP